MAIALASEPAYPLPNKTARLTFTPSAGGNYVRVFCEDAPEGSSLKAKLKSAGATRVDVLEGDTGTKHDFTPDVAGSYVFAAQEIARGAAAYGGGYADSPDTHPAENLIGETTVTLRVGGRVTLPVGVSPDTAELVLYVWNDTIRATSEKTHGEISPAIINGKTDRAKTTVLASAVISAVESLAEQTASGVLGTLSTIVTNLIVAFNAHLTQATVHAANDADNAIDASFRAPTTPEALRRSVREILTKIDRHMQNDNGNGAGSAGYHAPGGTKQADWANKLVASSTGDLASSIITLVDCWRAYEAHRVSTAVHNNADNANAASALSMLLTVHRRFLEEIVKLSPTAPATANSGVTVLVHGAGAKAG